MEQVYAAQDVLPTGVRRRRALTSGLLPVVLLGELMAGVVFGAVWEATMTAGRPAGPATLAEPAVGPAPSTTPDPASAATAPEPAPSVTTAPSLAPSPVSTTVPAPTQVSAAEDSPEPLSVPAAEPVAVRNPFAAVG